MFMYQYDERGYLVSVENTNGDMVSYVYDNLGRKAGMTYELVKKEGINIDIKYLPE